MKKKWTSDYLFKENQLRKEKAEIYIPDLNSTKKIDFIKMGLHTGRTKKPRGEPYICKD